jgi:purine catabolism regulator
MTVREALKIGGLRYSRLVAGEAGLDRTVGCVDILEVPDASAWLQENELLVTTCYAVRNDPEGQLNILRAMARSGSAALAVKFGRFIGQPPPDMLRLANELGVPLIDVPDEISFLDITHPIMADIVNKQAEQLAYSENIHRRLTMIALATGEPEAVARELASILGKPVAILTEDFGHNSAVSAVAADPAGALGRGLPAADAVRLGSLAGPETLAIAGHRWAVFPVDVQRRRYGYILVRLDAPAGGALSEIEIIAVEHSVTAAALQLVRAEAVREARRSYKRDLLEDLIAGAFRGKTALSRGEAVDLRLDEPFVIMVADIDGFTRWLAGLPDNGEETAVRVKDRLLRAVEAAVAARFPRAMVVARSDSLVAVLPAGRRGGARELRSRLQDLACDIQTQARQRWPDMTLTIGVSATAGDPLEFSPCYTNVRKVIRLARKAFGPGQIAFWDDMEIYTLLSGLGQPLERFYEGILGAVDKAGVKNRGELINTLRVYLECQGNMAAAAEKLFIHRNTLRYRLTRLRKLLDRDWETPEGRFALLMALKIRNLLDGKSDTPAIDG